MRKVKRTKRKQNMDIKSWAIAKREVQKQIKVATVLQCNGVRAEGNTKWSNEACEFGTNKCGDPQNNLEAQGDRINRVTSRLCARLWKADREDTSATSTSYKPEGN